MFFVCPYIFSLFVTYKICPNFENESTILGIEISNGIIVLLYVAILLRTRSYLCTAYNHNILYSCLFILKLKSIANSHSLITVKHLLMTLFKWGVWGVMYSKVFSSFQDIFCNFDWCSLVLSQNNYSTVVLCDIIFSKHSAILFGRCDFVSREKPQ